MQGCFKTFHFPSGIVLVFCRIYIPKSIITVCSYFFEYLEPRASVWPACLPGCLKQIRPPASPAMTTNNARSKLAKEKIKKIARRLKLSRIVRRKLQTTSLHLRSLRKTKQLPRQRKMVKVLSNLEQRKLLGLFVPSIRCFPIQVISSSLSVGSRIC